LTVKETNPFGGEATSKIKTIVIILSAIILCLVSNMSLAFNQANLDSLLATGKCEWCDLTNANLSREEIPRARLANSNLSGANLSGADLTEANLSGANLSNANLSGANLTSAFLRGALMKGANLSRANLYNSTLDKANLQGADVTDANLTKASLSNTIWTTGRKCEEGSADKCFDDPSRQGGAGTGGIPF
jgi:uncharacterized protein YjbI with pentapeptide repeats